MAKFYLRERNGQSLHLARLGSQSEHRIRHILPARGACHIIKNVILVSGKFTCFLEIDIFTFKLQVGNCEPNWPIYSASNAMFMLHYNYRTNVLVYNLRHCSNMSRSKCDLSCLASADKYRFLKCLCFFFSGLSFLMVYNYYLIFLKERIFNLKSISFVTATRHPWKSPASEHRLYCVVKARTTT